MRDLNPAELAQLTWLDINEASAYTRRPVKHLRTAVRDQRLRHIRSGHGGKLSFNREWLDEYMHSLEHEGVEAAAS